METATSLPKDIAVAELQSGILHHMNLEQVREMYIHLVHTLNYKDSASPCTTRYDGEDVFTFCYDDFPSGYQPAWPNPDDFWDIVVWLFNFQSGTYYCVVSYDDKQEPSDDNSDVEPHPILVKLAWTDYSFLERAKQFLRYFQLIGKRHLARLFSAYISQQEQPLTKKHGFKRAVDADEVKVSKPKKQTLDNE